MPEMPSSVAAAVTAPTAVAAPRTSCTGSGTNGSRPVGGGLPDGGGRTGVGGTAPSLSGGVPLGVVNPKAWLTIAAVCASGRLAQGPVADAVAKAALLTVVVAAIRVGWLLTGRLLTPLLRVPRAARAVNVGLAAVLVGAAAVAVLP